MRKWIVLNDLHIPFQDKVCVKLALDFIKRVRPYGVILLGDIVDFYQISRFAKDPSRANLLQDDIDEAVNFLRELSKLASNIHYLRGNHEARLQKFLWSTSPCLSSLDSLQVPSLLKFKELGVTYHPDRFKVGDMTFIHGKFVRRHAGYSAKAHYDKYGVTMMHGHTHRDAKYTIRTMDGHKAVWENYCMCSLDPEYDDFPNWTQGFSLVTFVGKRPYVEQIAVIAKSYVYGGKMYS